MKNTNFVHKHVSNKFLRFFYRLYLYININYVYGLKYKYLYSITSFLNKRFLKLFINKKVVFVSYFNRVAFIFVNMFCNIVLLVRTNKSSLSLFYAMSFTVETAFVFYKNAIKLFCDFIYLVTDNINYAYIKYATLKQRILMQTISQHTDVKLFLISPLFYKRVKALLLGIIKDVEKGVFNFAQIGVRILELRERNIAVMFLNSSQRFSPYNLLFFFFKFVCYFIFYIFSLVVSSFVILFYSIVIKNLLFIFTNSLDFLNIFSRVLINKSNPKYKPSVIGLFYYGFYIYNLIVKFVFSFNFKSMVDSSIRFIEFMIEHNGDLFYDRGNYWLNLKRLENLYRFNSPIISKKEIMDNFQGRNFNYTLDQGKVGIFNINYDDGVHEDDENEESFNYDDNHQVTREEEMEYAILSLLYRYGIFMTTLFNNLIRIPFIVFISFISDLSFFRAWISGSFRGIGKWGAEFDMELMKRSTNPYLRAHFDTFDMWCPYNNIGVIMRNKIYVTFVLCLLFIDSVFTYDGWFFPFEKEVIVFRGITYSPMWFTCFFIWVLVFFIALHHLEGEPSDKVIANFITYEEEETYTKDFENYLDYRYSLFYNIVLTNYYMGYVLYSKNHVLFFWRTEEIKKIKKIYQNKNMVFDHMSLDPLSKISETYLDLIVFTTKTVLKSLSGIIN